MYDNLLAVVLYFVVFNINFVFILLIIIILYFAIKN